MSRIVRLLVLLPLVACVVAPGRPRTLVQEVLDAESVTDPRVVQCLLPALTTNPDDPRVQAALAAARARGGVFVDGADYLHQLDEAGRALGDRLSNETVPLGARDQATLCRIASRPIAQRATLPPMTDDVARLFAEALRGVVTTVEVREDVHDRRSRLVTKQGPPDPLYALHGFHDGRPVAEGLLDVYRPCWSTPRVGAPDAPPPSRHVLAQPPRPAMPKLAQVETVLSILGDLEGYFASGAPTFPVPDAVWTVEARDPRGGETPRTLLLVQAGGRCLDGRLAREPQAASDVFLATDDGDRTLSLWRPIAPPATGGFAAKSPPRLLDIVPTADPTQVTLTWDRDGEVVQDRRAVAAPARGGGWCGTSMGGPSNELVLTPWPDRVWAVPVTDPRERWFGE